MLAWMGRPALLRSLLSRLRLAVRLLREPLVPMTVKALAALPALYVLSPIDVLPDVIPILGQLDDLGVVLMVVEAFVGLCPAHLVEHHRQALETGRPYTPSSTTSTTHTDADGPVIDAEWRRAVTPSTPSGLSHPGQGTSPMPSGRR